MLPLLDKAIVSATFIGRATELGALNQWLAHVSRGHSQIVCVAGEAGIGKSRLAAEVRMRAEAQGWQTVQGACFEPDAILPYAPLIDLLRTYLARRSLSEVWALLNPWAPEFVKLLPELALLLPALQPTPRLDPEAEKRRLFDAFVHFLGSLLQKPAPLNITSRQEDKAEPSLPQLRPLLLIIEDLHWSDDTSLEFLRYLARRLAKQPLLLLLTYRSDEIHPALHHFLAALDREQRPVEVTLPHFTTAEVDALLRAIFDLQRPVRSAFLDTLYALTEGNPFFIEEVLKVLVAAGDIFYSEGQWDRKALTELRIPRTVQDAVQRRTAQLSPATRAVLNLAAVTGRRFDFALLQAVTGHDETALLSHIKELLAAQLVIEATADQFAFRHALTQQAIYTDLLARERKILHRTIGETMEQLYSAALDAHLADLAYHFYAAEVWDRTLVYAQRAGEQAQALYAPNIAVEQFSRALAAANRLSVVDVLPALYRGRGLAYETLGEFEAARADLETVLHLVQSSGERQLEWQALIDLGDLWPGSDYAKARSYFQQALALAYTFDDRTILARNLHRIGNWYVNDEQQVEGLGYYREALAIYQVLHDQYGLAATFDRLGAAYLMIGDHVQGVAYLEEAASLFRQLDDRRNLAFTLGMLAGRSELYTIEHVVAAASGVAESIRAGELALQLAREIGWRATEAYALIILGRVVSVTGEYTEGLTLARQGYAIVLELEHRHWRCNAHFSLGLIYLELLAPSVAQQHFAQALIIAQESASLFLLRITSGLLAFSSILCSNFTQAEEVLAAVSTADMPPDTLALQMGWLAQAELAFARGNAALCCQIIDQLIAALPNIEQVGERGVPGLALLRGKALMALARLAEAEAALQAAYEGALAKGLASLRWRTQVALGHCYQTQGKHGQASRAFATARAIIDEVAAKVPDEPLPPAGQLAEGLSLQAHFVRQATALLPPLPHFTERQVRKHAYGGLTAREVEVAIQVTQGKSNREIAHALVVGERTIETHVSNILSKLGFSSRQKIATWATEKGLAKTDDMML